MNLHAVVEVALPLFLIMDPVGNSAACLALLRDLPAARQRRVILRELLFALAIVLAFYGLGEGLLRILEIHQSTLRVAGGVILFIIALKMVFPSRRGVDDETLADPFIVPIAVPFIAGPSLLAAVMLYAHRAQGEHAVVLLGIGFAWLATGLLMVGAPTLVRMLGERGTRAAERLMGLILVLLAVQMLEDGCRLFIRSLGG